MKIISLLAVIALFVLSCGTEIKTETQKKNNPTTVEDSIPAKTELSGVWIMTNYLDSVLTNKTVAKYRMLPAAWFGIIIQIKEDSLFAFGSIHDNNYLFNPDQPDSLCTLQGMGSNYRLRLNNQSGNLELRFIDSEYKIHDSVIYTYQKRNELQYLTESNSDIPHKTSENFTRFFNNHLIAGRYETMNGSKVEFSTESIVFNLQDFYSYQVRNYFGTLHPFEEMDVLILKTKKNQTEFWNWKFESDPVAKGEKLILTRLDFDRYTDKYSLSAEKIILKKVK